MGEKMTLEQVRDVLRNAGRYDLYGTDLQACDLADAIDAHITQPAQAVDVGQEVVLAFRAGAKWADATRLSARPATEPRALSIARASNGYATAALPKDSNGAEGV